MPTFQEYLLVDQYSIYVEHHVKTSPNQWLMSEYRSADINLSMSSVDCRIRIADLYEGTIL
jgi:Uma2 family endonuclease